MILRSFVLIAGLAGAFGAAQFPSYSQQYLQRLGGAVDALGQVVADFDASAGALGLSRQAALAQMQGTPFVDARRADMERTFARFAVLEADLKALRDYGPFMRAYHASHLSDAEIARGTWSDYQPTLPLNFASAVFAGFGFIVVGFGVGGVLMLLRPRRRRPMAA
ncbi:MAG: DUF2937 family protein [Roseobacter sp.]